MMTSALLIHLTGGRIETHFHIFGSLAFLAFYRDWKVMISASVVVVIDHFFEESITRNRSLVCSQPANGVGSNTAHGLFLRIFFSSVVSANSS